MVAAEMPEPRFDGRPRISWRGGRRRGNSEVTEPIGRGKEAATANTHEARERYQYDERTSKDQNQDQDQNKDQNKGCSRSAMESRL